MAVLTITTTPAQDVRIATAFGNRLGTRDANGVRRDANLADVKADVIRYVKQVVMEEEQAAAARSATSGITEITPL